ncbi:MAG: LamG domain-containing protein [Acidobacteriota bacterium]
MRRSLVISVVLLGSASAGQQVLAGGGTFPPERINGLQVTYEVAGATLDAPQDELAGFTRERALTGTVTNSAVTISGTAMAASSLATISILVEGQPQPSVPAWVRKGDGDEWTAPFRLSVPATRGTPVAFSITVTGFFPAGTRTVSVNGSLDTSALPATPVGGDSRPSAGSQSMVAMPAASGQNPIGIQTVAATPQPSAQATPPPAGAAPSVPTGPVAYYPFNGNANDESGNKNHGTVTGATLTTDRSGTPNSAYAFNGAGNLISVPHSPSLSFDNDMTVAAWVKTADTFGAIAAQHNGGGDGNFLLSVTDGKLIFGRSANFWMSNPVADARWHHVAGVYDNTRHLVSHYVDGVMVSSKADAAPLPNRAIALTIGDESSRSYGLEAVIDDVRLYNRALSDAEIRQLYLLPSGPTTSPAAAQQTSAPITIAPADPITIPPARPPVVAPQPPAGPPTKGRTLTGAWVPWTDLTYSGVNPVIIAQDGQHVSLWVSRSEAGSWLTMTCEGALAGDRIAFYCTYAPGGNPFGYGPATMSVALSADGNHLDGVIDWSPERRQPAHFTRRPADSGPDSGPIR